MHQLAVMSRRFRAARLPWCQKRGRPSDEESVAFEGDESSNPDASLEGFAEGEVEDTPETGSGNESNSGSKTLGSQGGPSAVANKASQHEVHDWFPAESEDEWENEFDVEDESKSDA